MDAKELMWVDFIDDIRHDAHPGSEILSQCIGTIRNYMSEQSNNELIVCSNEADWESVAGISTKCGILHIYFMYVRAGQRDGIAFRKLVDSVIGQAKYNYCQYVNVHTPEYTELGEIRSALEMYARSIVSQQIGSIPFEVFMLEIKKFEELHEQLQ